jgi:hypothetical protein
MPINVSCPECDYRFLVGDEFAGRPGRCPECSALIQVPGEEVGLTPLHPEPFDEFPAHSRRRDDERRHYEEDLRDDYRDDLPRRAFDPLARADKWQRVHKGLGYLQIAVILYFFLQLFQIGFYLVRGLDQINNDPNALPDSGEWAVIIGGLFVLMFTGTFWVLGRLAMIRVPYVPARGWARASFYMVLGSIGSLGAFCCLFMTFAVAAGGGNPGAAGFLLLAAMAILLAMVLVAGGELCGLMALAKAGDGLQVSSAANWARTSAVLLIVLIGLLMFGFCGFVIYVGNQQKQKQQGQAANAAANPNGPFANAKANGPNNPPGANPPGPQQQQQNPFGDDPTDPKAQFIFQISMIGLILLYLVHYSVTLQKGRRAIRDEIHTLTGHRDERHDRHRDEHY